MYGVSRRLWFILSVSYSGRTHSQGILGEPSNNGINHKNCKSSVEVAIDPKKCSSITCDSGDKIWETELDAKDRYHQHFDRRKTPNI